MTLSNATFSDAVATTTDTLDVSSGWDALYCSHLWSNSDLRNAIINAPFIESKAVKYCYTCKGKIRKYELKTANRFLPSCHSTPNVRSAIEVTNTIEEVQEHTFIDNVEYTQVEVSQSRYTHKDGESSEIEVNQCIPSISHQIDSNFRQKYTSYGVHSNDINQRRLRKSLKGIGCVLNFALTESPVKKRTQIQACSISVMIIAIVVISFILVNFATPNFSRASTELSTNVVPIKEFDLNETSSAITKTYSDQPLETDRTEIASTSEAISTVFNETTTLSSSISKIRKNIKTYPRDPNKYGDVVKPKDINNRDLSKRFCSCQRDEVCMLDENSGTAICKKSVDDSDPTGCGGLCALETEACQLVDRARGVRVCRLLTLVSCSAQEWRCRNGLCVPEQARCDGSIQCYDRSDEMHCECDLSKQFRCGHSISCFANTKLCNGVVDCWDGFDEANCTTECADEQSPCTDGQCILSSQFCDGLADCTDGSDEPLGCDGACGAHEVRCKNHRCISRANLCDGQDNCGDASDELNCSQ